MKTIKYIVYPPNYKPEDFLKNPYYKVGQKSKAFKLAMKLGNGSEIFQDLYLKHSNGFSSSCLLSCWILVSNEYFHEFFRNGKYINPDDLSIRVLGKNLKYSPIFRKPHTYKGN